ncbi:hypothetical protein BN946_scf184876.g22 [Trametes cinnabarina]|uniref:ABC transmembrane type-1 domain-containing protein n=1 Tax=Pycnoporus cinnabarinus TaxID=5643 RepID=A0A060SV80_PYCCI|nr:hypothetical protein BN946_scf184876.g22 [Trametes cinnabarina]
MQSKSQRHLGLLLIWVFRWEFANIAAMSITAVVGAFAAPISINQLLRYLESDRAETPIKPWFWIALFFFGGLFKDVSDQWFLLHSTRLNVRTKAIITELVFEHALRIRVKAETSDSDDGAEGSPSTDSTAVATPDSASQLAAESAQGEISTGGEGEGGGPSHSVTSSGTTATLTSRPRKGKGKSMADKEASAKPEGVPKKPDAGKKDSSKHLIGRINNLVSSDLSNLGNIGTAATFFTIESPFQIILGIIFLYQILGWSALVGLVTMLITLPVPGWITKRIQDARVQTITETLNVIRMIKLFGWESRIAAQLDKKREEELAAVRKSKLLTLFINMTNNMIPILIMLSTFSTYTVLMKKELTASRVFSCMAVFDMLRMDLQSSFNMLPRLIRAKVSLEHIADFLRNTELIDEFERVRDGDSAQIWTPAVPEDCKGVVGIRKASFTWSKEGVPSQTPGGRRKRAFVLTVDEELLFQRGKINLIVGPTGAGKTSLLMALLVLHQCALNRDLSLFDAGDETEVGEKGITLSGGQKARVTLARAVYSTADILLLDDILAALDVHTSKWIVEKCLKGDLLEGRTIILVTHNVAMVSPVASFVVDLGPDGRILSQGSLENALARDSDLLHEIEEEQEALERSKFELDAEKPDDAVIKQSAGKLVVDEEREEGHVGWAAFKLFLSNMSSRPLLFWFIYVSGHVLRQALGNLQTWYLGY